jgi:hypothetical protein
MEFYSVARGASRVIVHAAYIVPKGIVVRNEPIDKAQTVRAADRSKGRAVDRLKYRVKGRSFGSVPLKDDARIVLRKNREICRRRGRLTERYSCPRNEK